MVNNIKIKQYVRLNTGDDWDGLYGIILETTDDYIIIFCMNNPTRNYIVKYEDAEEILEILHDYSRAD